MKLGNGGNRYPKFKLEDEVFLFSGGFFRFGRLDRFFGIHGAFEHGDRRDHEDARDDPFDGIQRKGCNEKEADGNADTAEQTDTDNGLIVVLLFSRFFALADEIDAGKRNHYRTGSHKEGIRYIGTDA